MQIFIQDMYKNPPIQIKATLSLGLTCLLGCFPCSTLFCRFLPLNSVLGLDLFGLFLLISLCLELKGGRAHLFVGRVFLLLALWDCYFITIPFPLLVLSINLHLCLDSWWLSRH